MPTANEQNDSPTTMKQRRAHLRQNITAAEMFVRDLLRSKIGKTKSQVLPRANSIAGWAKFKSKEKAR